MSEIVGPTFGDLQNTVDQITRVLPTAAVTGFHFIAGQISPDSLCTESQVAQCCPPPISDPSHWVLGFSRHMNVAPRLAPSLSYICRGGESGALSIIMAAMQCQPWSGTDLLVCGDCHIPMARCTPLQGSCERSYQGHVLRRQSDSGDSPGL